MAGARDGVRVIRFRLLDLVAQGVVDVDLAARVMGETVAEFKRKAAREEDE